MRKGILALALAAAGIVHAVDLGTYKGCAASDADFEHVQLVPHGTYAGNDGPMKMALHKRGDGLVDVYFTEKNGTLKKYDPARQQVDSLGKINCATGSEDGLVGIALDPAFDSDRYVYLYFSFQAATAAESGFRVSRFTLGADGKLDLASEKVLIKQFAHLVGLHTAGAMAFDAYGDLWITVGDNERWAAGPANTADFRGGILRIHPDESARGYSIPKGNYGEHISAYFKAQGKDTLALAYADTARVKPEIYVKGTRNAYTLTLDPVRRWAAWGEVGPDQGAISEEYNLIKEPYYMGWPFFAGDEALGGLSIYGSPMISAGNTKAGPVVTVSTDHESQVKGVPQLPPVRDPIFKKRQSCAMGGPIFRYDGANPSSAQFPPQLNRKWIIGDCLSGYGFHLLTLDSAGEAVTQDVKIFAPWTTNTLTDLEQGPDGALYYVNHGGGIDVIRYKGACKDPALLPEKPTALRAAREGAGGSMRIDRYRIRIESAGPHDLLVSDLRGRTVLSSRAPGPRDYSLAALQPGLYQARLRTAEGVAYRRIVR